MGQLTRFSKETWSPENHNTSTFFYIEIGGVDRFTAAVTANEIPVADAPSRARMKVRTGDIIVSLTRPHHGSIALIKKEHHGCIASTGFAIIRNIDETQISKEYLVHTLRSSICLDQMLRRSSGGNYPAITEEELANIKIPVPPAEIQCRLVAELDPARVQRDQSLAEAESLLASIDSYVLELLAILPHQDPRRVFAVRRDQVSSRLDADYHSPQFQRLRRAIENGNYPSKYLSELVVFMRSGFAAGRRDQALGGEPAVPHLRPLNLSAWGELSIDKTKSVPASSVKPDDYLVHGEVLFNNTNSAEWVGKSGVYDLETPCACSNHMTRISLKPGIDPYFIAALLNAFRGIGYFSALSTFFNNQAGINTATLAELRVPVPSETVQKAIAKEVVQRKAKAMRLRTHAENIWQEALSHFEQQLLHGGIT
ncbi:restriction endonuclease subunit S [Methanothrix harundinacea]|uniref:restriction endonuclease subunit S n=1 Tax=Methanothrix harundinacea TaxID=301375 RepID=UPI001E313F46|nr:restriction endonuclease subunit S [Methanothrix harundinacea]